MYTFWHNTTFQIKILVSGVTILGAYFLFLTLFIHFYQFYESTRNEQENLKQIVLTASLKYQQLKAQLSPHFLFNNISVLTALIEEDQKKAIKFSEGLSSIYRYFLAQEKQDVVKLKEELAFADEYLNLLKVRYENALTYSSPGQVEDDQYILPLVLQQVFENVVKHNEISMEKPMDISISIHEHYLIISNQTNPKSTGQTDSQTGLMNITDRYLYFTDKKVILDINSQRYTIKLPILNVQQ
jgi:LytS/YehU family sensor histidine kinase